jgi:hypothetical protein
VLALGMAWAPSAHALDTGVRLGIGAGLAGGPTSENISEQSYHRGEKTGGGLAGEVNVHGWAGPVIIGVDAVGATTVLGPSDGVLMAGAGGTARLGERWRLSLLGEGGRHTMTGLGSTLFVSPTSPSTVRLTCWGARLAVERTRQPPSPWAFGFTMFYLVDQGRHELTVRTTGLIGSGEDQRVRAGGRLFGMMFRVAFGSGTNAEKTKALPHAW